MGQVRRCPPGRAAGHGPRELCEGPLGPIPQASKTWKATKATYRFFDNERVAADEIASAEQKTTARWLGGAELLLAVPDATTLSFTGPKEARGLFMHSALVVRPDGAPEGFLDMGLWARDQKGDIKEKNLVALSPSSPPWREHPEIPFVRSQVLGLWLASQAATHRAGSCAVAP